MKRQVKKTIALLREVSPVQWFNLLDNHFMAADQMKAHRYARLIYSWRTEVTVMQFLGVVGFRNTCHFCRRGDPLANDAEKKPPTMPVSQPLTWIGKSLFIVLRDALEIKELLGIEITEDLNQIFVFSFLYNLRKLSPGVVLMTEPFSVLR